MFADALAILARQGTVITANQRQTRAVLNAWATEQTRAGRQVWESADVLPWRAWLQRCWEQLSQDDQPLLLNIRQERLLWESVLRRPLADQHQLVNAQAMARSAQQAWTLIQDWRLPFPFLPFSSDASQSTAISTERQTTADGPELSEESHAFQGWALALQRRCREQGWLEAARLPVALAQALEQGVNAAFLSPRPVLGFYGFEEIPPAQQYLLKALQQRGAECRILDLPRADHLTGHCVEAADAMDEIHKAAHWTRLRLLEDPNQRIAWVVPDLQILSEDIRSVLTEVLTPSQIFIDRDNQHDDVFNISLSRPLSDYSLIHAALLVLQLAARRRLPLSAVGQLLRSPWSRGFEAEAGARADIDRRLRMRGELDVSIEALLFVSRGAKPGDEESKPACPLWLTSVQALQQQGWADQHQGIMEWVDWARQTLDTFGWPGFEADDPAVSSHARQCLTEWQEQLSGLIDAGLVLGEVSAWRFIDLLTDRVSEARFQPGSGHSEQAPLQVLGIMEAAGLHFDAIRFIGLHNEAWPVAAHPNPLLPLGLQRQRGLPHSSAQRELHYARGLLQHLCQQADEICFSYPRQRDDAELQISGLLSELRGDTKTGSEATNKSDTEPDSAIAHPVWNTYAQSGDQQSFVDEQATATSECPGGTRLLKLQSACPFQAFASLRLGAEALEVVEPGLDARIRGNLVHDALQRLWEGLGNQQTLMDEDHATRQQRVEAAVEAALDEYSHRQAWRLSNALRRLEQQRLTTLLLEWLELELRREAFYVVACERNQSVKIANCELQIRLDRLDRLSDGSLVVMDYKTGVPSVSHLLGERPDEPQLPLYALALEAMQTEASGPASLSAVSFGQLRAGQCRAVGLATRDGILPGVATVEKSRNSKLKALGDWQGLLGQWRAVLPRLLGEFSTGLATVDPKKPGDTCTYCKLGGLCRIQEYKQQTMRPASDIDGKEEGAQ